MGSSPRFLLVILAVYGAVLAILALLVGTSALHVFLALSSGLLLAAPVIHGLLSGQVVFWVMGTFAIAAAALVLASVHIPASWLRWNVIGALTAIVWLSLAAGLLAEAGFDIESLYYRNSRTLLGFPQLGGVAGHPNGLGIYTAMALALQIQVLRTLWRRVSPWLLVGFFLVGPFATLVALIWSQSRGGQWAALAGLVIILLPTSGRRGRLIAWLGMIGLLVLSFAPWALAVTRGSSFNGRIIAWEVAWREFWDQPVVGYGPDLFRPKPYWAANPGSPWEPLHAHQEFLQVAGTTGLIGVALLACVVAIAVLVSVRARLFDARWAMGAVGVTIAGSALEVSLGVAGVLATYLPGFLALAVLGSSIVRWRVGAERSSVAKVDPQLGLALDSESSVNNTDPTNKEVSGEA